MREPYVEGSSDPPRPRVMAACSRGRVASVDRGKHRPGIELRNHPLWGADLVWWQGRQYVRRRYRESPNGPTESETPRMCGRSMHENREIPSAPVGEDRKLSAGRSGKACGHNPDMHAGGKSHIGIVPVNAGNKAGREQAVCYGGPVHPPRNRKSGSGNPSPKVMRLVLYDGLRTCGRKGR